MNAPLFRPEVVQARRQDWLGRISLAQPMPVWVGAVFALLAAGAVACLLLFGEYAHRSRVGGQLVPDLGVSTMVAPTSGMVGRMTVEEGASVARDQALVQIDLPRVAASGADAHTVIGRGLDDRDSSSAQLAQAQLAQLAVQEQGQHRQLAMLRTELGQVRAGIATRDAQVRLGRETADRYREVAASGYVSVVQVRQQEQAMLEMLNARQVLERQATALAREIAGLEQALAGLPAQREAIEATARREHALLAQERYRHEADGGVLVKAPLAGLVAHRFVEPGQAVQAGQPLLSLLPEGARLQAQLQVPSRAIGFIRPGDRVRLRYQAYPFQKFGHQGGRVARISRSAVPPVAGAPSSEPHYRILVALDRQDVLAYGRPEPLRPGMLLEADILGERRKLHEWLLEPLYSLRGGDGVAAARH
ncbi:HlyD family efflux transporter periplasmic adaptor subunit [Pseudoxanthomonas sp. Soil82]|uniref:HlyD family secretion protein n=1 Tax=Pseudoxanthomonas sp. Soil82 TaxID=3157341 RepID=UPI00338ECB0F